jgi:ABC-type Mn2+/Zn2+ transport system permease subunit
MNIITEPWRYQFFPVAVLASMLVLALGAVVGVSLKEREQIYLGQGVSQSMLAGAIISASSGVTGVLGAFIAAILSSLVSYMLGKRRVDGENVSIAITSSAFLSIGVAVLSMRRERALNTTNLLFGNVLGADWTQVTTTAAVLVLAGVFYVKYARRLSLIGMSREVAGGAGLKVRTLEITHALCVAAAVAVSVHTAGVLLTIASLVIPGAIARCWTKTLLGMYAASTVSAVVVAFLGIYVSYYTDIPSGPAVCLIGVSIYAASAAFDTLKTSYNN